MKWDSGDDYTSGGNFLTEPGSYHFTVTDVDENPTKRSGELIDGFRVNMETLAGTVEGCEGKTFDLLFFYPQPGDKNEGAFSRKKIDRFFLSSGIMEKGSQGKSLEIDLPSAVGRQVVAKLEMDRDDKHLRLAFSNIYHVDDPAVKDLPKNKTALKLLPQSQRLVGSKAKNKAKPPEKEVQQDIENIDL